MISKPGWTIYGDSTPSRFDVGRLYIYQEPRSRGAGACTQDFGFPSTTVLLLEATSETFSQSLIQRFWLKMPV